MNDIIRKISGITENISENEPLKAHTTFKTGGPARFFVSPTADELPRLIAACREIKIPMLIIGRGSNMLVSDEGFDGVVIHLGPDAARVEINGDTITAEAGASLIDVSLSACREGLTGFEFATGIPGSVGGAVIMNAGAYGGEIKQVIESATAIMPDGSVKEFKSAEMELSYRSSIFEREGLIVTKASFKLLKGDKTEILKTVEDLKNRRMEKQPLEFASAGSTFKRPEGYFAGKLIEDAGLKGYSVGDACVSEKHAGFVINKGSATAADVYDLICHVKDEVKRQFNVDLEPEVKLIGNHVRRN